MAKQGFVNIHGKEYETVASRVNRFREKYPEYTIKTTIIKIDADECIVEAGILNEDSRLIANGHAQEFRANSQINKTSYVENCETSAIGRALAAFGIGGTEFASANEVVNAIHQQNTPAKTSKPIIPDLKPRQFTKDEMDILGEMAAKITEYVADKKFDEAIALKNSLENEEKTALWFLLKSETRTAYKKYTSENKL
jgi:hypothetical protein